MKRFLSLLITMCALPALSGCSSIYSNYREIQQLMVVQTMGIDREKGGVQVSMAAAAEASGGGPRRMSAQGSTITAAIDRAYKLSYEEEIFFSHVNHLLVGEAAAEEGLDAFLDYVSQSPTMRIDIPLYIVRGSTANQAVMEVGDSSKGISEVMQTVHESFASPSNSRVFTVADTINSLLRYGSALVCAVECVPSSESVSPGKAESEQQSSGQSVQGGEGQSAQQGEEQKPQAEEGQNGQDKTQGENPLMAVPAGYAVIRDGKLCKFIEPEEAAAVGLLTGSLPITDITVTDRNGKNASLELNQGSAEITPVWGGKGQLKGLNIQAQVSASVLETDNWQQGSSNEYINHLTAQLESAVSQRLSSLLRTSMKLKADFLGLAGQVERKSPENYRLMSQRFSELLPGLELQITVSGQLSHTNDMKE
ncbi:MAG: Ger(x)C family spore germination C-terminal domain-containing protein [Candidatus Limivicinus sp.]|nr:Ger(x)C family spore germination C-terminal domain-containing protein [Candidatus Limivicinus sp.]